MDISTINQQTSKFKKARGNLLTVLVLTVLNLLLAAFNVGINFPFSATAPQIIFEFGRSFAEEFQNNLFLGGFLVIAFIVIGLYFMCWIFSKRWRAFMLVALIFFSIDSLVLAALLSTVEFEISYLLDVAFHGWVMLYLSSGAVAWAKLRGVSADEWNAALQETAAATTIDSNANDVLPQGEINGSELINSGTIPLRADDKKGRILIASNYDGLQISMKRTRGLTELIVNGNVYAEATGLIETDYSLTANVQQIKIAGVYKAARSRMYLYANDILLAKKFRLF